MVMRPKMLTCGTAVAIPPANYYSFLVRFGPLNTVLSAVKDSLLKVNRGGPVIHRKIAIDFTRDGFHLREGASRARSRRISR
jgi:hypothetical protein